MHLPLYLAGRPETPNLDLPVIDKYTGETWARVPLASPATIDAAIAAAHAAVGPMRAMPAYARREVLEHCVERFRARFDELAMALCIEAGKPIRDSRGEVTRLIDTFRVATEECARLGGEVLDLEISARAKGYSGMVKRVPVGACSFLTPFNFPLNLVAHKVAPAIAAGCPFVLKPSPRTPVGALIIGEILAETALPPGAFSVIPCRNEDAGPFTTDPRLKLMSFTGSPTIGWALKAQAGQKKVVLELGGNAACVVEPDWNLDDAAARILIGAFYQSGQSCISVQRIYAHRSIYDQLKAKLVAGAAALVSGDPKDEKTFVGPMIDEREALRVEEWVNESGGTVLVGGKRNGAIYDATLLEGVARDKRVYSAEVFGPVAILEPYDDYDAALDAVNASEWGLQAGVFTRDLYKAHRAWDRLEVGGVVIGDVPSWRVDHMPYGGVKGSGLGREGVRYAIEDMTEPRLMVVRTPPELA